MKPVPLIVASVLATLSLAAAILLIVRPTAAQPPLSPLGSAATCAAYSGLPPAWRDDAHAGMVHIDGGRFVLGSTQGYVDERPAAERVEVDAFWIDRTEVTNAQFAAFVDATAYVTEAERQGGGAVFHQPTQAELGSRPYSWWAFVKGADWRHPHGPDSNLDGLQNHPVTLVTQADALSYARWLDRDLPTEAEWEYAAKAGHEDRTLDQAPRDASGKPLANYWQGVFPTMNLRQDGHDGLAPVGCFAASDFALYDMIGNAWEWTRDVYNGPHVSHANGDIALVSAGHGQAGAQSMVIKGGSFLCSQDFCVRYRAAARESQEADLASAHIGFRTVKRH
ncbi:formylglycine-generating enzyme family protein [Hydrocarboniphaga sp.]|uniref:formylglycine-generating enzyme family protein n=1 Tax=Hydrocarboniphaga sp. TaxID=2033016 RepID=UPI003D13301C